MLWESTWMTEQILLVSWNTTIDEKYLLASATEKTKPFGLCTGNTEELKQAWTKKVFFIWILIRGHFDIKIHNQHVNVNNCSIVLLQHGSSLNETCGIRVGWGSACSDFNFTRTKITLAISNKQCQLPRGDDVGSLILESRPIFSYTIRKNVEQGPFLGAGGGRLRLIGII